MRSETLGAALFCLAALVGAGVFAFKPSSTDPSRITAAPAVSPGSPIAPAREPRERSRSANRITGIVRDANGMPVGGARVGASDPRVALATSDASGRFELTGLASEPLALYALLEGHAPARLERVPAESRDVELVLLPPARIEGELSLPAGAREVLVSLCRSTEATTKELCVARRLFKPPADRYALERLAPGNYEIVAELPAHPRRRFPVTVNAGELVVGPRLAWQ